MCPDCASRQFDISPSTSTSTKFFPSRSRMRAVSSLTVSDRRSGCKLNVSCAMVFPNRYSSTPLLPVRPPQTILNSQFSGDPLKSTSSCLFLALSLLRVPSSPAQSLLSGKLETQRSLPPVTHVVEEVRAYRLANEDR